MAESTDKQAQEALLHLHALADSADEAIMKVSKDGIILSWNAAAERIYGYSALEAVGMPVTRLASPERPYEIASLMERLSAGEHFHHYETVRIRNDGTPVNVSLNLAPIRDESGAIVGFSTIATDRDASRRVEEDLRRANQALEERVRNRTEELLKTNDALKAEIGERKRTEEELRKAREMADGASLAKSQFIANMSHEMRTPLAAILGYAEMMYDAKQTVTERLNCIGRIRQNIKNLTELVNDILDLSKVESGKTEICPVTFSLLPELGEVFSLLQSQAWKKRLSLDFSFEGDIPETISTDPTRFRQILVNIISNAIKFTDRGGISVTVSLLPPAAPEVRRGLSFVVSDTGCGIPVGQQEQLFQPFVQADGSLTRPYGGSGLGLVLSRRVARTLGGDVVLTKSTPERGSTFTITLDPGPLEGVRMMHGVTRADLDVRQPAPLVLSDRKLDGMRVLLVEDAPDIQILVRHFLKRCGAQVEVADNGYEGIKKAKAGKFDLVLMDIQMPVLNGYEATAQLHKEGCTSPIVALTAHAMKGVKEKCLEAGCDDYLTKPINAAALIELILRYYRKSRGARG